MTFRRILFAAAIAPAITSFAPSPASAGPILDIHSDAKGGVSQLINLSFTFNGQVENGLAGTLTTMLPSGRFVDTYCIDMYSTTYVGNGGSTWSAEVLPISSFTGNSSGNPTGGNWGAIGYLYSRYAGSASSAVEDAALQVAIWKVEYDNSADLSSGYFRFADSVQRNSDQHQVFAQANSYLAGFDGTQSSGNATLFRATSHPNGLYQDLVGPGEVSPSLAITPNAVPEPSSIALAITGIGCVALAARRKARRVCKS